MNNMNDTRKKRKIITMAALILIAIALVIGILFGQDFFANLSPLTPATSRDAANPYVNANIEIKTFKLTTGWGYNIYIDGKLIVHQENIPALPGNDGFKTEADAKRVAGLVVDKIKKNIMPPSLSTEELNSAGITAN
jgi:hypothetical protein